MKVKFEAEKFNKAPSQFPVSRGDVVSIPGFRNLKAVGLAMPEIVRNGIHIWKVGNARAVLVVFAAVAAANDNYTLVAHKWQLHLVDGLGLDFGNLRFRWGFWHRVGAGNRGIDFSIFLRVGWYGLFGLFGLFAFHRAWVQSTL